MGGDGVFSKTVSAISDEKREHLFQETYETQGSYKGNGGSEGERVKVGTLS